MSIHAVSTSPFTPSSAHDAAVPLAADQASFSQVLAQATRLPSKAGAEEARDAAQRFVASTLINPILTQLRESSEAAPPFAPSTAEKQFRALMDAELAQRITRAAHFPLVDRLAHDLLTRSGMNAAPQTPAARDSAPTEVTP